MGQSVLAYKWNPFLKKRNYTRYLWLTSIILYLRSWDQEDHVWSQPRQRVHKTPSQPKVGQSGMCLSSQATRGKLVLGRLWFQAKKVSETASQRQNAECGRVACHPSNGRKHNRRIVIQAGLGKKWHQNN
jgi:hypothetical protein